MALSVVILAAGQGTRMRSDRPKVLQPLAGRPLLSHVLDAASTLTPDGLHVVYGHGGEQVPAAFPESAVRWVEQAEQLGTGHAVAQALPGIPDEALLLVLYGDVPLISPHTLHDLVGMAGPSCLALLTVKLPDPTGYGRIVRDANGALLRIVEEKDATSDERRIDEVNTGILAATAGRLRDWLARVGNDNSQGEYYLTDVVALAVADGLDVVTREAVDETEVLGVNTRRQLATLERSYQQAQADRLLDAGVTLADPARLDVRGTLRAGRDVSIDIDAVFEGEVVLGDRVSIGPFCILRDVRIGDDVTVHAHSVIEQADIGNGCEIGPFARLRPQTVLAERAKIGNFVEIKKSNVGPGSKVNHLSYVGDAEIGHDVNVGAGTITCNYDGHAKHLTRIGDRAFIGSDTQLVAPVTVGAGATVAAGTTVTRDVPPDSLALSRSPQRAVERWQRPGTRARKEK